PDGHITKPLKEVATFLNVHFNTLHRWIKAGKIECVRYGRNSIYFTYDQVQDFINGCKMQVKVNSIS
ncbi:MAG: helix-turn-helix domain-containing protein, partial [bacterium]|nr:helix-turn-helix domain-containing protein [bacterium]